MATTTFTFTITSVPSTSVTVTPVAGLVAPVPVGTIIANVSVAPVGWLGGITLSGTNAASLKIGGVAPNYNIQAASVLNPGTFSATVTVTP